MDAFSRSGDPPLYNKRLLDRTTDCRRYWKAEDIPVLEAFIQKYV